MLALKPKPERAPLESELLTAIMRAVNATGLARVFRNNCGKLRDANGRVVTYGLATGSADLVGVVRHTITAWSDEGVDSEIGRFLALEVKRPGKRATEDQELWCGVVRSFGGIYEVVTSVEEALAVVDRAR